jgi:hypothetical protein
LKLGASAPASPSADESNSERPITRVRPTASESHAAGKRPTPTPADVTASDSADVAGETWNASLRVGSSACVL